MRVPLLFLGAVLIAVSPERTANAEVFVERAIFEQAPGRADIVTTRQILVNGIPSVGRSWIADEEFTRYAERVARAVPKARPLAPVVRVNRNSLSVVEFLPDGAARVLSAHPAGTGTSVWQAELAVADLVSQRREAARGIAPGRDHPLVGAPASARRANVVEVLAPGYSYSAVYVSATAPCALVADRVARLKTLGATIDAQDRSPDHCSAALSLDGYRVDLSAVRSPTSVASEFVLQTNLPPKLSAERLK